MQEQEREEVLPVQEEERRQPRSRSVEQGQLARRDQKQDCYEEVSEVHRQGVKGAEIGRRVGIGERTVYRWLAHGSFPQARRRRRRPSLIDPYERYVISRWHEGRHSGSQLYQELRAKGYKGSRRAMYSYLVTLRTPQAAASRCPPP